MQKKKQQQQRKRNRCHFITKKNRVKVPLHGYWLFELEFVVIAAIWLDVEGFSQ